MVLHPRGALIAVISGTICVFLLPFVTTTSFGGWFVLWAIGIVAIAVFDWVLAPNARSFALSRDELATVRQHETVSTTLTVRNMMGRRARLVLRDAWQPSAGLVPSARHIRLLVGGRESETIFIPLTPTRRGDLESKGVSIRSWGPLGLAGRQADHDVPGTLRVLPPFLSRKHLPSKLQRLREIEGMTTVQVRGQGTEFDSLREYVIGDDVRSIDWRATARRQSVVVRTWRPERDRRVVIVLDTSRLSAARIGDQPRLDAAMDAALLLAAVATKAGDRVDFIGIDRVLRGHVSGRSSSGLLNAMVHAMVPLQPALLETDWAMVTRNIQTRVTQRSFVVLLTPLDPSAAHSGLINAAHIVARHNAVAVASVTDPSLVAMSRRRANSDDVIDAAAAERSLLDQTAVTQSLMRGGVTTVEGDPAELPPRLVDHYLALKASGAL